MKNLATNRFLLAAVAYCVSGAAFSAGDDGTCSNATLRGLYVFSASGFQIVAGVPQPKAIVEPIRFNGDGTLSSPGATRSVNGAIFRSPAGGGASSYSLGADCIGSLSFDGGPTFDIFASPKGEDMWMIQTNPNNVFQGNVIRVSTAAPNCDDGSSEVARVAGPGCRK